MELALHVWQGAGLTYRITYSRNNEIHTIDWIAPSGWSETAVVDCFHQQYPGTTVLTISAGS